MVQSAPASHQQKKNQPNYSSKKKQTLLAFLNQFLNNGYSNSNDKENNDNWNNPEKPLGILLSKKFDNCSPAQITENDHRQDERN